MKIKKNLALMVLAVALVFAATVANATQPKYVFFFLGDGMANSQIQATEAYLATKYAVEKGWSAGPKPGELSAEYLLKPENRLNMSKMTVQGMQTTYDAFALMTDSASAGTAFACGAKTRTGAIGMEETLTTNLKSIAQLAHENGKKVGIISSVSLDHATPASYYASVTNRGLMNNIATQLANSGYEFFGGGGLVAPTSPNCKVIDDKCMDTDNNIWNLLKDKGYTVLNDRESILALKKTPMDKVVCINPWLQDSAAMPYDIDRPETNLSLKEMTEVAIASLYDGRRGRGRGGNEGFFIMVEGGKIDWACHANDAMATIGDMLDFDNAVGVALEFMRKHPLQTLVVVTGDHETGGMTIGHATTAYKAYYERLLGQKNSFQFFGDEQWAEHKAAFEDSCPNADISTDMIDLMADVFGLVWDDLNDYQKEKLEDAYDMSLCNGNDNSVAENKYLYGGYNPIVVTITHILNEQASIGWTSYSHTGVPVPVFAQGREAVRFAGFYDNTEIAKKLAKAMDIREDLPVEK